MQQQKEEQEKRDQVQERRYLEQEKRYNEQKEELEKRDQIQERRYLEPKEEQEKRYKEQKEEHEKRDKVQERRHQQFKEELMNHLAVREQQLEEKIMQSVNESVNEGLEAVNQRVLELEKKFREQLEDDNVSTESFSIANAKIKPPDYDGTTAWEIYKTQFEAAAKANGWSEPQKATSLVVLLRGKAAELLQSLSTADQSNYAVLVHSLQLRFGNEHKEIVFQAQLRIRQQKSGESLQEFEADIDRLIHLAYPSAPECFQRQFAAERFIEGVRDSDMRYHLRLIRPRNISEALFRALEFEASRVSSSSSASVRVATCGDKKNTSMAESLASLHKAMKDMAVNMQALLERTPRSTGNRAIKCFNCGKLGHVKSNSRNRVRSPSPLFRRPSGNQERPRFQEKPIHVNVRGQLTEPVKTPRISQVNQSSQVNNLGGKSFREAGRIKEQKIQIEHRPGRFTEMPMHCLDGRVKKIVGIVKELSSVRDFLL